jgi:hypothetical protein
MYLFYFKLIPIDGSTIGSDHSRSQTSLNTIDPPTVTKQQQFKKLDGIEINNQFVSMQSISSTASSMSNNENMDRHHKKSSNKHNQIYDSLNNQRKSTNKHRQQLTLKDLNAADDTATETESLINAFDDMRMIQQQQQHRHHNNHKMNGKRSSSSASSSKPTHLGSFSKLLLCLKI